MNMQNPGILSDFRSTYLRSVTKLEDRGASVRRTVRLLLVMASALAAAALLLSLRARVLPDNLLTQALYALHDYLLLPFIGYTYTYFFPISLIWWGVAMILFFVWLFSFVTNYPLLRSAYYKACEMALADQLGFIPLPFWHYPIAGVLVTTSHAFRRAGLRPRLFEHVVQREHLKTLHDLITTRDEHTARRLQRLADLRIRLNLVPSSRIDEYLDSAVLWSETLLYVQFFGNRQFLSSFPTHRDVILDHLKAYSQDGSPRTAGNIESRFRLAAFGDDLEQLTRLALPPGKDMTPATRLTAHAQMVNSVQTRQRVLEQIALRLQSLDQTLLPRQKDSIFVSFNRDLETASPNCIRYLGRFALNIAEFAAFECGMPELAFNTLETFETLAFVVPLWKSGNASAIASSNGAGQDAAFVERLQALRAVRAPNAQVQPTVHRDEIISVPDEQDYRLAAELAHRWHEKMSQTTDASLVQDKDSFDQQVLRPRALGLLGWQGLALDLARGPFPHDEM